MGREVYRVLTKTPSAKSCATWIGEYSQQGSQNLLTDAASSSQPKIPAPIDELRPNSHRDLPQAAPQCQPYRADGGQSLS